MKTIMIIDDELRIIEAFLLTFQYEEGYRVLSAHDGADALQQLTQTVPDLVVLDWRLQGDIQGRDILRYLKESHPATPVFVVTASIHFVEEIQAFKPAACLLKPCPDLKDQIIRALDL